MHASKESKPDTAKPDPKAKPKPKAKPSPRRTTDASDPKGKGKESKGEGKGKNTPKGKQANVAESSSPPAVEVLDATVCATENMQTLLNKW